MGNKSSSIKNKPAGNSTIIDNNDNKNNDDDNNTNSIDIDDKLLQLDFIPHFILMGDSVLDNIAWIKDKNAKMDVVSQLNKSIKMINNKWCADNLAVDGNTTQSLIKSLEFYHKNINQQIQPKRFKSLQYFLESNSINMNQSKAIIVLSIGGNDVLGYMYHINQISANVVNDLKKNKFIINYEKILNIFINECKCDVIIIFCYEPHIKFCVDHNVSRNELLKIMYFGAQQIFNIADKYKLPIIDLSRTGNPYNKNHYSSASPIEPNEIMGKFTVNLILYLMSDFEWDLNKNRISKIYYGQNNDGNGLKVEINDNNHRINYLKSKMQIHPLQNT